MDKKINATLVSDNFKPTTSQNKILLVGPSRLLKLQSGIATTNVEIVLFDYFTRICLFDDFIN